MFREDWTYHEDGGQQNCESRYTEWMESLESAKKVLGKKRSQYYTTKISKGGWYGLHQGWTNDQTEKGVEEENQHQNETLGLGKAQRKTEQRRENRKK